MLRGLYTAASGMLAEQKRLDVVANNLANMTTPGYKRETTVSESFPAMLLERMTRPAGAGAIDRTPIGPLQLGAFVRTTAARLTTGQMQKTDQPLDLALQGDGFFTVRTPQGVRYTREGRFKQDDTGALVTEGGLPVLDVAGNPIVGTPGSLRVTPNGQVESAGQVVAQLGIITSQQVRFLRKEGGGLWSQAAPNEASAVLAGADTPGVFTIRSGFVESSNVDPVAETVEMMTITRSYEANQRVIRAMDETLQKAVTEVGRL